MSLPAARVSVRGLLWARTIFDERLLQQIRKKKSKPDYIWSPGFPVRGVWTEWGGRGRLYTYRYTVTTIPTLRLAAMRAIFPYGLSGGEEGDYTDTYRYTVTTIPTLRLAAMRAILMFQ